MAVQPGAFDPSLLADTEVVRAMGSTVEHGLSAAEATERLERHGPNRLDAAAAVPAWREPGPGRSADGISR